MMVHRNAMEGNGRSGRMVLVVCNLHSNVEESLFSTGTNTAS